MSDELLVLTAEQSTLQQARDACLQDMQGRTTFFLTSVSGTLVALSFLGSANHFGNTFLVFSSTLLLCLWVLGMLSFGRIAQIGAEDEIIAFGMARIRHRYIELFPNMRELFVRAVNDDSTSLREDVGATNSWVQAMMPIQALVSFVVSVVGGCEVGVVLSFVGHAYFVTALAAGVSAFALNILGLTILSAKIWTSAQRRAPALFPASRRNR